MSTAVAGDITVAMESGKKRQCDEEPERSPFEKRLRLEEKIRLLNGGGASHAGDGGPVPPTATSASVLSTALPSTPPSSHPALDRAAFRERLSSFAPTLWPAFHPVTPVDCALRGFRLVEADLIRCVACPATLSGRLASSDVAGARERSVEALRKNLGCVPLPLLPIVARHTRFCPFSSMASSPAFADPVLDSASLLDDFSTSVKAMERFGRAVPRFTERTVSRIAGARSHLVEYVLKQVRSDDDDEEEEDVWKSRIVLALTGWELSGCGDALTTIKCNVCNRKRGAWECHTFETPPPPSNGSSAADEIFPAESDEIVTETVNEVVLEEVNALASEALSDAKRAGEDDTMEKEHEEDEAEEKMEDEVEEEDEGLDTNAEKDPAEESNSAEKNESSQSAMHGDEDDPDSEEDSVNYIGKKHKALQRSDDQDDRASDNDDTMDEDNSDSKSVPGSPSKAASETSTSGSADDGRAEVSGEAEGDTGDVAEEGRVEPPDHQPNDDLVENVEVRPEDVNNKEEEEKAKGQELEGADKDEEEMTGSEQDEVESEGDHDGDTSGTRDDGHSESGMEIATKDDNDDNSSPEKLVVLAGRPTGSTENNDEEENEASSQEEIKLLGSATQMEEADNDESVVVVSGHPAVGIDEADKGDESDDADEDGSQEEIVLAGSASGKEVADKDDSVVVISGHPTVGINQDEDDESDDADEGSQDDVVYPPGRSIIRMAMGHFGPNRNWDPALRIGGEREGEDMEDEEDSGEEEESEEDDENGESAEDGESSDEREDHAPILATKSAAPPAADSDSDVICLSSDDDEDGQENLREAKEESEALEDSTEVPSSEQTTPMNSTMEQEEEGASSATGLGKNSTIEVQSSVVRDSSAEERGTSPIPNLDGTFDFLPEKRSTQQPLKFFNPLEHLPWCTWVRPTSFDPSVTGATALAIRLEQLVAKRAVGKCVEEQPSPAVNGICKLSPEDKLKKLRDALNESYEF